MMLCVISRWYTTCSPQLRTRYSHRLASIFQFEGDVWAVTPPAFLSYRHEVWWHLSRNLQSCRTVFHLNYSLFTAVCLSILCYMLPAAAAAAALSAFISTFALESDVLRHGLYLVTGGGVRWVGWLSTCHLLGSSLNGPAVNQLWKITSHSVGDSWVYSKDLVTSNMLSMNLSRCRSKASPHPSWKPMSTALFCDCVHRDCSFEAYYNFSNDQGVCVYIHDGLQWHILRARLTCAREYRA